MNIDYTELFQALIALLATLITTFVIPLIRKKLSTEKTEELKKWVGVAVKAAEQLYGSKTGQEKREYVVSFLVSKGIVFDVDEVNTMIEAEVYKLTQGIGE
jgi:hypothetical protein